MSKVLRESIKGPWPWDFPNSDRKMHIGINGRNVWTSEEFPLSAITEEVNIYDIITEDGKKCISMEIVYSI